MLLHVSTKNYSNLQRATIPQDTLSVLFNLSAVNGESYTCDIIPQIMNSYLNCIKIIVEVAY
jgi:hypothetical protein